MNLIQIFVWNGRSRICHHDHLDEGLLWILLLVADGVDDDIFVDVMDGGGKVHRRSR